MHMDTIAGEAQTRDAIRIMRRLCKHWGHKYEVTCDEAVGVIQLNDVRVTLRADSERLFVTLDNPITEVPKRLMAVVSEHLQRMAAEQVLEVKWIDQATANTANRA
jgi:uncharacterized protein